MEISWYPDALEDFMKSNAKIKQRISRLIEEIIVMGPLSGTGKPEILKWETEGMYSRRVTGKDRLVYCIRKDELIIVACRNHYDDR